MYIAQNTSIYSKIDSKITWQFDKKLVLIEDKN